MREFDLLRYIYDATAPAARHVLIGPGDDMAMVRLGSRHLLAAVDQLVAGRHVDLAATPLELVGRKAIARSLSDVAAMAGTPVASLVAVTLPPDFSTDRATRLFDALRAAAGSFDCPLIGGDIAFHGDPAHPLTCSVTVLAEPHPRGPVTRGGAQAGDRVYVTGSLGGSVTPDGQGRHLTFTPRIAEAKELADALDDRLHAMIDISDGLGRDASHIAACSDMLIELDARAIPCREGLEWRRAAGDGEDYELLFTAAGEAPATLGDGVPVTAIGRVAPRPEAAHSRVIIRDGNRAIGGDALGWQHES